MHTTPPCCSAAPMCDLAFVMPASSITPLPKNKPQRQFSHSNHALNHNLVSCRSDINDTGGRFTPHQAKGTQLGPITVPPMQMSDKTTPPSITPERSSYLNSSRSAFDKRSLNHMVCQPIDVITCSAPQPSSTQQTGTVAPELAPFMPYSGSIQFRTGYVVCYCCCQNADSVPNTWKACCINKHGTLFASVTADEALN